MTQLDSQSVKVLKYLERKIRERQESLKLQAVRSVGTEETRGKIAGAYGENETNLEAISKLLKAVESADEDHLTEMVEKDRVKA